jgi:hypothetical protein
MLLKDNDLNLLQATKREGISKTGKPYLFYVGKFLDADGDVLNLKFGKVVVQDESVALKLLAVKNVPVTVDVALYPSGFNLTGTITSIDF